MRGRVCSWSSLWWWFMSSPLSYGIAPTGYRLPDATTLGAVHLQVADLARSIAYYRDVIGLRVQSSTAHNASMGPHGDERTVIELHELPGATPVPHRGRLGLFHVAILLPDRASLGRFLAHLGSIGERVGMSDHFVSEALYLNDPDGLGLEVYADRPRESWQSQGRQLAMGTEPLDARAVIAAAKGEPWTGAPAGTTVGHVHLHVGDLKQAATFYHAGLGFDKTVWEYPGALFMSAGGYHHHLGTNTWAREAVPPAASDARLLEWHLVVPAADDIRAMSVHLDQQGIAVQQDGRDLLLHDPWGTRVRVIPSLR